ncbi:MAG: exodeoxyribonuclease VII large subunit [Alphaproteobacteria bacterium]|jgi:exodeoxyribonuclease VII large subunit|nr:exodeoxyribonuclease VII large subunit [Alphaproteobacteria bacterium]QQS57426.1 MAG: exodeoxyribonuclease VII large subunit [Alphaproteobacteria bacterium]
MSTGSQPRTNIPEFSVTELAQSLKRTLEENYGRVRVRGELSKVTRPSSGHLYTTLKDSDSVIDAVCWKGTIPRLSIKPEEGLEVICTGRITTYAPRSSYQLVIESMELAGEGALLKMLEERRKKLAAEGLFDSALKKPIPFLPEIIGVVTSPTGAVIRDILHRLADRFPRRVLVWPVMVQGESAARQVEQAIRGFNALKPETGKRPDVLIIARGGGSLEDLMPFNEEAVVRAAAESAIPIISAIGHETDTTLIDFASDLRAPTPTGAAEMAVPVRLNLLAQVRDDEKRLINAVTRLLSENRHKINSYEARLGTPERILDLKIQKTDHIIHKMNVLFRESVNLRQSRLEKASVRLVHPQKLVDSKRESLRYASDNFGKTFTHLLSRKETLLTKKTASLIPPLGKITTGKSILEKWNMRLTSTAKLILERKERTLEKASEKLELLSFENILERGFAVVFSEEQTIIKDAQNLTQNQNVQIRFRKKGLARAKIIAAENLSD